MSVIRLVKAQYGRWRDLRMERSRVRQIASYIRNGRQPWSEGYTLYKDAVIEQSLNDAALLDVFRQQLTLPEKYGEFLDERVVEYPWFISRLDENRGRLLDAGSALNYRFIVKHARIVQKNMTIVTLEPESNCFWRERISYLFDDIRALPFRDDSFDEVVSISTLEHIGMDNSLYTSNPRFQEKGNLDYLKAVTEFRRVVKPGGKVFITVPYGRYTDFGWYQQLSADMIDALLETFAPARAIETYFCYESGGWSFSDREYCRDFEGFNIHDTKYFNPNSTKDYDPDHAACSRAIAALELWK